MELTSVITQNASVTPIFPAGDAGRPAGETAADDAGDDDVVERDGDAERDGRLGDDEPRYERGDGPSDAEAGVLAGGGLQESRGAHPRAAEDTRRTEREKHDSREAQFGGVEVLQRPGRQPDLAPAAGEGDDAPGTTRKVRTPLSTDCWVRRRMN